MPRITPLSGSLDRPGVWGRSTGGKAGKRWSWSRRLALEPLEDRRLLSIEAAPLVHPTLLGDTAGALDDGGWTWVSDDGRYVAFTSDAPNLVPGQVDAQRGNLPYWNTDVFLRDQQTGTTTLVSHRAGSATVTANGLSFALGISADGRYVLFASDATDLVAGQADTNADLDVFLFDRLTSSVQLVSHSSAGTTTAGNRRSAAAVLSADGSAVAFTSEATNLIAGQTDSNGGEDVFLYERATGNIRLVSRTAASATTAGNGASRSPSISADGRSVAFLSDATDLVTGATDTNAAADVFVYSASANSVQLVSHASGSATNAANLGSDAPILSADGQYVVYQSLATNLVAGQVDTNGGTDVFLFSRASGTSQLVSHASGSVSTAGDAASGPAVLSSDGMYVALVSQAGNLVSGQNDTNAAADVFLFRRSDGSIRLASHVAGSAVTTGNQESLAPTISADGRYVAFVSSASDLAAGQIESNTGDDVFVFDRDQDTVQLLSHSRDASTHSADGTSRLARISGNGAAVVYVTDASDLVPDMRDSNGFPDLAWCARAAGTNAWVSLRDPAALPATGNSDSLVAPLIGQRVTSADGRFTVFTSAASDLVAGQIQMAQYSVYLYDALAKSVELVSRNFESPNTTGNGISYAPTLSADGRYIAFVSRADDLVENQIDTNGEDDVFLFDRLTGTMRLVSHAFGSSIFTGDRASLSPVLSADGRYVVFASQATNLVNAQVDANEAADIFLYDREDESIRLVSAVAGSTTTAANAESADPVCSADGRYVVFASQATDLIAGQTDTNAASDVFLFDRQTGTRVLVSHQAGSPLTAGNGESLRAVISADGQYVAMQSRATNLVVGQTDTNNGPDVFLFSRSDGSMQLVSHAAGAPATAANGWSQDLALSPPTLSADGRYLAYTSFATNLVAGQTDWPYTTDVLLYDRTDGSNVLVSHVAGSATRTGNAASEAPWLSADGRFVAYTSMASDLAAGVVDANDPARDVFVFDRSLGTNQLASPSRSTPASTADSWSTCAGISADGMAVVLNSAATNLVAGDYNRVSDVFVFRAVGLVNHSPVLEPSVDTTLAAIPEDILPEDNLGTSVDSLVATPGLYSDADGIPPAGIAVTGRDNAHGKWQYSIDGGVHWIDLAAVSGSSATLLRADGSGLSRVRFLPDADFAGTTSLSFRAWDVSDGNPNGATGIPVTPGGGGSAYSEQTEVAYLTVLQVNDAPIAVDDSYEVLENGQLVVTAPGVIQNDQDIESDPLTAAALSNPLHGTLTFLPDGSFTYTPEPGYFGPDAFTYQVNDGAATSNVATVAITVRQLNNAPVAADHSYSTVRNRALQVAAPGLLQGASDADGDPLTVVLQPVTPPAHGALVLSANGAFTYTPASGYYGSDSFTYVVTDGKTNSQPATVTLTVLQYEPNPVVRAPTSGSSTGNKLLLRRSGSNIQVVNQANNQVLFSQPQSSIQSLTILGANSRADTLTVDYGYGAIAIPSGVTFNGGTGSSTDTLIVRSSAGNDTFTLQSGRVLLGTTRYYFTATEKVTLEGLAGNDTYGISALTVPTTISDSAGVDRLDFSAASAAVTVNLGTTSPQRIFSSGSTLVLSGTIENVTGTALADSITGNSAANRLYGGAGSDVLNGSSGNDVLFGGDGNDTLRGGSGNDVLFGEAGNDSLLGESGNNVLVGGAGNDSVSGAGFGKHVLIGGAGQDNLRGYSSEDLLIGGPTSYDANEAALLAILAEWTASRSIDTRIANLTRGVGSGASVFLRKGQTVLDDAARDTLYGSSGSDWFLYFSTDSVQDRGSSDR